MYIFQTIVNLKTLTLAVGGGTTPTVDVVFILVNGTTIPKVSILSGRTWSSQNLYHPQKDLFINNVCFISSCLNAVCSSILCHISVCHKSVGLESVCPESVCPSKISHSCVSPCHVSRPSIYITHVCLSQICNFHFVGLNSIGYCLKSVCLE